MADNWLFNEIPAGAEFVRYVTLSEWPAAIVACLKEQGIGAEVLPDGGIGYEDVPDDQGQSQREASFRCVIRFPVHPLFMDRLDSGQLRVLYDYQVGPLTECLKGEGYTVPAPPSVAVYIEEYYDSDSTPWSPWPADDPRLSDPNEWYRLNEACPQDPPLEDLYGLD